MNTSCTTVKPASGSTLATRHDSSELTQPDFMEGRKENRQSRLDKPLSVAMIGPSPCCETGTSILFKILLGQMPSDGTTIHTIPIPIGSTSLASKLRKLIGVLVKTIQVAPHVDVISAHVPTPQLSNVAFASMVIARIFRRAFIVRKFGGMDPAELPPGARYLAELTLKRSTVSFVETRQQRDDLQKRLSTRIFWYPNYRDSQELQSRGPRSGTRFVYVGRVCYEKGLREIVEATASLEGRCSVDVYGLCEDGLKEMLFDGSAHVYYRGVVANDKVASVLSAYDALLLPTYWEGEGYPGVIAEAFLAGLPVIATRWKFIPEMVDDTCGILVEPGDAKGLMLAMERLACDRRLARRLHQGALVKAREFSSERWVEFFVRTCHVVRDYPRDRAGRTREINRLYE